MAAGNRTLRVGIVGMSSDHVWNMGDGLAALPEVTLVAAAEAYPELREEGARRWHLHRTYSYDQFESMLDQEELDAILVCTDNTSKADVAEAAARRKIHVYQDKPMGATLAQADRILRAARQGGITLMVAYHSAFNPTYHQVKQLIAGGALGEVYLARGVTGHGGPMEYGCSKHFCEWLFDQERNGGGAFVDEACYLLDGFVDYLGAVTEVSAFTAPILAADGGSGRHRDYLPPGVEDNSVAILRFASGALGVIDAKWGQVGPPPVRTSYHGTRGTLTSGTSTDLYSTAAPAVPAGWEEIEVQVRGRAPEGLKGWRAPSAGAAGFGRGGQEQREFVDCVLAGRQVEGAASPQTARAVQEVIDAVYRSAQSGHAIQIPLK